jgi:hypothetical protein
MVSLFLIVDGNSRNFLTFRPAAKQGSKQPKYVPDEDSLERNREAVDRIASDVEFVIENFDFALEPGKALESYL